MTDKREEKALRVVGQFASQLYESRRWQLHQMLLGLDIQPASEYQLLRSGEAQEWLHMARAGLGLIQLSSDPEVAKEQRGYVAQICQDLAEWLFATPIAGSYTYTIPESWYDTEMGSMWGAAYIWAAGDDLITIREAADLLGLTTQAIGMRIDRGIMRGWVDPSAPPQQGRRLVSRKDVLEELERLHAHVVREQEIAEALRGDPPPRP